MEIVYVSNERYARHLGVSVYSLYDHNREEDVGVTVVSTGISDDSKEKLNLIAREFGREITFCDLTDIRGKFDYAVDTGKFDISTMGRLFIGDILPVTVDRALYLDCDTVVLHSLKHLWETDLSGKTIGAVPEPTIYREVKEYLGLDDKDPYYNAGVLLINLTKWRAEKVRKKLISFYGSISGRSLFHDQDAINGVLKGEIKTLSPSWNFFTNYRYFRYEDLKAMSPSYARIPETVFEKAKHHPAVVHFAGDERPWILGSMNHYGKAYDTYLELTPWRGTPKEPGSMAKMFAYHMMDYMTYVYPEGRKKISNAYFRKISEERSKHE